MCEFCTKHGEGKKWYLEMKNYAEELLHEELGHDLKEAAGAATRLAWANRFWENFVMPAVTGIKRERPVFGAKSAEQGRLEHFGQVLPIEDVEQVVDRVDSITRMPCGCRFMTTGRTDQRYCFGLGIDKWGVLGRFPEAKASLEVLDRKEAKKLFRRFDREGLIHSVWTGVTPFVIGLCNCDRDCAAYKWQVERGKEKNFFRAEYVAVVDPDRCEGCRRCFKQCQFAALFWSSALGKVYANPARCYGCGVCRAACRQGAITLAPRREVEAASGLW
jgi:NAD-dependent dihydropyrimidine dehydrogenase PreA subunit